MPAKLTVIIPVYNEKETIDKVVAAVSSVKLDKEIVIVDDGSTDGTREILAQISLLASNIRVIYHEKNQGKGKAIQTGIAAAGGEYVIIQDADMEYDPSDYKILLEAVEKNNAAIVYGSRFLSGKKVTSFWHKTVNSFLTQLTNVLYGAHLTDMETCYKLFRTDIIKKINIQSHGFEVEPEITLKSLRMGFKILEVPISYKGRSYHEGKKIGWKDGVKAVAVLIRYRF